jgi:hypothetical protein
MNDSNRRSKFLKGLWLVVAILLSATSLSLAYLRMTMKQHIATVAVRRANESVLLRKQLGSPIKQGYFVSGRIVGAGADSGTADLSIPVSGPLGEGTLILWSQNGLVGWHVCSLVFRSQSGQEIDIAADAEAPCERE